MQKTFFSTLYTTYGQYLLLICLLLILSPYFYLSFFAHPIADDYSYSYLGKTTALPTELKHQYLNWNGRYISNVFVLLNPLAFNSFFGYKAFSAIQIAFSLFSIFYFFRTVFHTSLSLLATLNACILFLLIYLFQMPSLAEGIYWFTGAVSYQTGLGISLVYFGILINYFNKKYIINKTVHFISAIVLLIVSSGFNEVLTLLLPCFHLIALFLFWKKQKRVLPEWVLLSSFSLICTLIMAFAPGNTIRDSYYKDNHNIIQSLAFTSMQTFRFTFEWILPLLLSSCIFSGIVVSLNKEKSFFNQAYFFKPWVSALFLVLILCLCIFPPYWGTNILGQHRTVNVACFFFTLFWFLCVGIYSNVHSEKIKQNFIFNKKAQLFLMAIILCIISATKNGYTICTDILYGRVDIFDREMQERYAKLRDPENKNKTVYLKELSEKPASLFVLDISSDSTYWANSGQAKYFGVNGIVCKDERE